MVTPCACAHYAILGSSDGSFMLRSADPEDAEAWHKILGYAMIAPVSNMRFRWLAGETVCWLKATSGSPSAIVEFIPG